jgi:hypothetical protein
LSVFGDDLPRSSPTVAQSPTVDRFSNSRR